MLNTLYKINIFRTFFLKKFAYVKKKQYLCTVIDETNILIFQILAFIKGIAIIILILTLSYVLFTYRKK